MKIRDYRTEDAPQLWSLFFNTIRKINVRHYSQAQVEAWAPSEFSMEVWHSKLEKLKPFVAELDGVVVGYTDLQESGLIDHFFCHHDYQGMGVGRQLMTHILNLAEQRQLERVFSEVSITARPFYEHFGFIVVKEQTIEVRGQTLNNFIMEKRFV
ncbi:GNAT family N-acetyltransferase [Vibrio sp. D404a]|uniref:GNAT family N-acetyltransferase n=1 Tax=unclassified Vibrio TaxID=2614977 RepID=UPI002554FDA5|nr:MULTISPECIES: GNAT family N-acetyltransferase [unclassified Vibrio]MDK9738192.1 GNAT family N-acetyltransferase [Vibrio sp. D404a]MDK9796483.1 GNAT family N-acetyltransferase [Vibrio sp. D449a]